MPYLQNRLFSLFLATLFATALQPAEAQNNWLRSGGGNANDEILDATIGNSASIYTTGYFSQSAAYGGTYLNSAGFGDVVISRQASNGVYLWTQQAGGGMSDRAYGITTDANENVLVTGFFTGTAQFGSTTLTANAGSQDIFVSKLDSAGAYVWSVSFGGSDVDIAYAIDVDVQGNSIVTGQFKGTAQFGANTFVSTIDPITNLPSYDIFIIKLDPNGNLLWAKHGAAKFDDRGMGVAVDSNNDIIISGQFSDTLTFTNTYTNNAFNSGFVMKLDTAGNEQWLTQMVATQVLAYGVDTYLDQIYVTGNFQGQLSILSPTPANLSNTHSNNIFVARLASTGNVVWVDGDGSNSPVSSLGIVTDATGNAFIAGVFQCRFDEYSDQYGTGVFNSVGFRDVFVTKYDVNGSREWFRQFGGPGDDYCAGIGISAPDQPILAGSFERNFNVPRGNSFQLNSTNQDSSSLGPNQSVNYCGDPWYGKFVSVRTAGNKDAFVTKPVDLNRQPYDYYERVSGANCVRDTLWPYLNQNEDTIIACNSVGLYANLLTGKDGIIGPGYEFDWSQGGTAESISVTSTGDYVCNWNFEDGCRSFSDSMHVIIYQSPAIPTISTTIGQITQAIPQLPCLDKLIVVLPDTATLIGGNITPGYDYHWTTPFGTVYNDSVQAYLSGNYMFFVTDPTGNCIEQACLDVTVLTVNQCTNIMNGSPLDWDIDGVLNGDSVIVCAGDVVEIAIVDSALWVNGSSTYIPFFGQWTINGGLQWNYYASFPTTFGIHSQTFTATQTGWCTITCTFINPLTGLAFTTYTHTFWLEVIQAPPNNPWISGVNFFCPGDTVMLTANGGDNYEWSGPGIVGYSPDSTSVWVTMEGNYSVTSFIPDTVYGCHSDGQASFTLMSHPAPQVTMVPGNGLICPGDSVLLIAEPGSNYVWVGPLGNPVGSTIDSLYVSTPGMYHYVFDDLSGCNLVSEFVEIVEYTTPYLEANPGVLVCDTNDMVTIGVNSNDNSLIVWQSPLSGNATTQTVQGPGTYSASVTSCGITTTVDIIVIASTVEAQITVGGPTPICIGDSLQLLGNSGMAGYQWGPSGGQGQYLFVTQPGTYYLTTTSFDGCTAMDSVVIDAYPATPSPLTADVTLCTGDSALLTASGSGIIDWYAAQYGGNSLTTGPSYQTPGISVTTIYYVSNSDSLCSSARVPVNVIVNPSSLSPNIVGDTTVCPGDSLVLSGNSVQNATYNWTGPSGFTGNVETVSVNPFDSLNTGYYLLQIADSMCTSPYDSIFVDINPVPDIQISTNGGGVCSGVGVDISASTTLSSYLWLPNFETDSVLTVTQPGTYQLYGTDLNGCADSSHTVTVTTFPAPADPIVNDTTICFGDSVALTAVAVGTLEWYDDTLALISTGATFNTSALIDSITYYVAQADTNGCLSNYMPVSVFISAASQPPLITANTPLCLGTTAVLQTDSVIGATYNWTGPNGFAASGTTVTIPAVSYADTGSYSLQLDDGSCTSPTSSYTVNVFPSPTVALDTSGLVTICLGSSIDITAMPSSGSVTWLPLGVSGNTITATAGGIYFAMVSDSNSCTTLSDTVTVDFYPTVPMPTLNDTVVCQGDSALIVANYSGNVLWYDDFGNLIDSGSVFNTGAMYDTATYFALFVNPYGCGSSGQQFTVYSINTLQAVSATSSGPICEGGVLYLNGTPIPGATYNWTGPNGFSSNAASTVIPNIPTGSAGVYTFTVYGACGSASDTTSVVVNPLPAMPALSGDLTYCEGDTAILIASASGGTVNWGGPGGFNATGDTAYINAIVPTQSGTYNANVTSSEGCVGPSAFIQILVYDNPQMNVSSNGPLCDGDTLILLADDVANTTYTWTGPNNYTCSNSTDTLSNADPGMTGYYVLNTVNSYGCVTGPDSVFVEIFRYPTINLGNDTTICNTDVIAIELDTSYSYYLWQDNTWGPYYIISDSGTYYVDVAVGPGCLRSDTIVIETVLCDPIQPNVFTPNGDGVNDFWMIEADGAEVLDVDIYDRWGKLMYRATSVASWDGTNMFTQKECPDGVYYYVVRFKRFDGNVKDSHGYLHLIRNK